MSVRFAMSVSPLSAVPAGQEDDGWADAGQELLAQAVAGPGFWEDWLGELRREGLISELLTGGAIAVTVCGADHGHQLDRALTAEVTAMCVLTGTLFPGQGYPLILARVFAMPGLAIRPGTVTPSAPALSKAPGAAR